MALRQEITDRSAGWGESLPSRLLALQVRAQGTEAWAPSALTAHGHRAPQLLLLPHCDNGHHSGVCWETIPFRDSSCSLWGESGESAVGAGPCHVTDVRGAPACYPSSLSRRKASACWKT